MVEEEIMEKDMTPVLLEDLGMRYPTEKSKEKRRYGLYQCQYCGKKFETQVQSVKKEFTKSCGCQSQGHRNPHGLSKHPLYQTWKGIIKRCYNPKCKAYINYGERGITITELWRKDFKAFYIWAISNGYRDTLSIYRINNDGNYEPDNCRWVKKSIQMRNTRDIQKNNTSGFRGVHWNTSGQKWESRININNKSHHLGLYQTALEAAKAYETYIRLNNLEHNFTPALTEEEIEELERINNENS